MKKRFLLLPLLGLGLFFSLSSYVNGYGSNRTGSHGGAVGCGSCHGSANSSVGISVELDSAGTPVTSYKPGMTYTLKVTGINNTSATNLAGFGGQMSIVAGSGTSSTNAGTLSAYSTGMGPNTGSGSIVYLEHMNRISATTGTGGAGTTYVISATWTAPTAGTGTVKAFGLINAVNCNNNDGSGDYWNSGSASFTELPSNVGVNNVAAATITVYPNPVSNVFTVSGVNGTVNVFDVNGKIISTVSVNNTATIDASAWANGVYFLSISNDGQVISKTIVKQ